MAPIITCSIIPNHLRQLGDNSFTRFDRQCCQNCWQSQQIRQPQDVCSVIELNMSSGGRQPEGYQMVMSDTKVHLRVLLCSNPILYNIDILQCILFNSSSHQWYHHIAEFIGQTSGRTSVFIHLRRLRPQIKISITLILYISFPRLFFSNILKHSPLYPI